MIRVLVVDDSAVVRKAVSEQLRAAGMEVVGEATNGSEAVEMARRLKPDVVLTDLLMPGMDGVEATRRIMREAPTRVVVLTGLGGREECRATLDALSAGALEVCAKPHGDSQSNQQQWQRIVTTVRAAVRVPVSQRLAGSSRRESPAACGCSSSTDTADHRRPRVVVIGASTGGPSAVRQVLEALPGDFPATVFVAVHSGRISAPTMANWLADYCSLPVSEVRHGEEFAAGAGRVYVPPAGADLTLVRNRLLLSEPSGDTRRCTPSIDRLFFSAADAYGPEVVGVLLTGMGADGAAGLKYIRERGGRTVAQDESTCVVYGMPAAAVELQAAEQVLPLTHIPDYLVEVTGAPKRSNLCHEVAR